MSVRATVHAIARAMRSGDVYLAAAAAQQSRVQDVVTGALSSFPGLSTSAIFDALTLGGQLASLGARSGYGAAQSNRAKALAQGFTGLPAGVRTHIGRSFGYSV